MLGVAYGCLFWKPEDLDRYTYGDLILAIEGYRHSEWESWERARFISYWSVKAMSGKVKYSDIPNPVDKNNKKPIEPREKRMEAYELFENKLKKAERIAKRNGNKS